MCALEKNRDLVQSKLGPWEYIPCLMIPNINKGPSESQTPWAQQNDSLMNGCNPLGGNINKPKHPSPTDLGPNKLKQQVNRQHLRLILTHRWNPRRKIRGSRGGGGTTPYQGASRCWRRRTQRHLWRRGRGTAGRVRHPRFPSLLTGNRMWRRNDMKN
jgi:hypothetical protein